MPNRGTVYNRLTAADAGSQLLGNRLKSVGIVDEVREVVRRTAGDAFQQFAVDRRPDSDREDVNSEVADDRRLGGRGPRVVRRSAGDEDDGTRYARRSRVRASQLVAVENRFPRRPQRVAAVLAVVARRRLAYTSHHRLTVPFAIPRQS